MKDELTPKNVAQLMAKEYLTPQEVAKLMRLNVKTVYSLLSNGELQGRKWGDQWRIRRRRLES